MGEHVLHTDWQQGFRWRAEEIGMLTRPGIQSRHESAQKRRKLRALLGRPNFGSFGDAIRAHPAVGFEKRFPGASVARPLVAIELRAAAASLRVQAQQQ